MINITKNYKILCLLNTNRSYFVRQLFGMLSWLCVIIVSFRKPLANSVCKNFKQNNFKLAFRQLHWLIGRSYLKLSVVDDVYFDFSENLTLKALDSANDFLCKRFNKKNNPIDLSLDQLYILARRGIILLKNNDQEKFKIILSTYEKLVCQILKQLKTLLHDDKNDTAIELCKLKPVVQSNFSTTHGKQALEDIAMILPITVWPWYVISGTFLGLYRENGFLAHDVDIDLGINFDQISNMDQLVKTLKNQKLFTIKKFDRQTTIKTDNKGIYKITQKLVLVKLIHRTGINVDLFIHYREQDKLWHGSSIHQWENTPFELATYTLANVKVQGPKNADLYLTENYGNWRVPVKNFSCSTGTPNLVIVQNLSSVALFLKKFVYLTLQGNDQEAKKIHQQLVEAKCLKQDKNEWTFNQLFLKEMD